LIKLIKMKIFSNTKTVHILLILLLSSVSVFFLFISFINKKECLIINKYKMLENTKKDIIGVYIDGAVKNTKYVKIPKGSTLQYAINKAGGITKEADIQNVDLNRMLKNNEKIVIPYKRKEFDMEEEEFKSHIDTININTASKEELMSLEGIGEKTAKNIIEYRQSNIYDSIDEILEVKGIGESKYEKIKENICI